MTKQIKKCPYCGKEVMNLGLHIINIHPNILEKLDESDNTEKAPIQNYAAPVQQKLSITSLIQEKLDIMLNIKIIEMLSKSPDTNLQDIAKALNPPEKTSLKELKEFHDMVYGDSEPEVPHIETGNQWIDIAQQAIPIVKEMLHKKQGVVQNGNNTTRINSGSQRLVRRIQQEAARDTREPSSNSGQSGITSDTKQQDSGSS